MTPRGTLLIGSAATDRIEEVAPDGRIGLVLKRSMAPVPIPDALRRDSAAALRSRLDSVPVPLDRVIGIPTEVREVRLPDTFPPYMAVYAPPDGTIWVRRWPARDADSSLFDVYSSSGALRTTVVLPRAIATAPAPVLSLAGIVAIAIDADTGLNGIVRFAPRQ